MYRRVNSKLSYRPICTNYRTVESMIIVVKQYGAKANLFKRLDYFCANWTNCRGVGGGGGGVFIPIYVVLFRTSNSHLCHAKTEHAGFSRATLLFTMVILASSYHPCVGTPIEAYQVFRTSPIIKYCTFSKRGLFQVPQGTLIFAPIYRQRHATHTTHFTS